MIKKYRVREHSEDTPINPGLLGYQTQLLTRTQVSKLSNTSFPRNPHKSFWDFIGVDPVLSTPKPETTELQIARIDGVVQDSLGNWVDNWVVSDRFSDYTDDNDVLVTKAEQEAVFLSDQIDTLCIKRKKEVDALRNEKVYTDIDADFNGTPGVIQFRGLEDRLNLTNVTQGAQANIAAGNPGTIMIYRDKSNYRHSVTSVEMLEIGSTALAGKQAIAEAAWDHKDAIKLLTSVSEIEDYDITVGWPQ